MPSSSVLGHGIARGVVGVRFANLERHGTRCQNRARRSTGASRWAVRACLVPCPSLGAKARLQEVFSVKLEPQSSYTQPRPASSILADSWSIQLLCVFRALAPAIFPGFRERGCCQEVTRPKRCLPKRPGPLSLCVPLCAVVFFFLRGKEK